MLVLLLAPSELRIELGHSVIQKCPDNFEFSQSKDNSGNLFASPFISILEMMVECNVPSHASYEAKSDQLQQVISDSTGRGNVQYTTQALQIRRRWDHGYRG